MPAWSSLPTELEYYIHHLDTVADKQLELPDSRQKINASICLLAFVSLLDADTFVKLVMELTGTGQRHFQ
jgi:hypothetical protein